MKTNLLRAALFTPMRRGAWGLPILLWGLPGVAKSAILNWLAEEYNMPIEVLSPAARGEGAFGVTPVPENGKMTYPRPDWTDKFENNKRGIVFIDEINLAATHYAGALLGLLQDRILGSYHLNPNVRIFAAANPIELAAASGGWDLSAPAANRVGHIEWPCPDIQSWTDWFLSDNDNPPEFFTDAAEEEKRVLEAWPQAWGKARGMVAGFLATNSTHLHAMPKDGSASTSKAWCSPRSWENAARALASSEVHKLSEVERDELVGAFIGPGSTGEFFTWYTTANLPDSADLLDGKVSWEHRASRLDITTAVFGSAVAVCTSTQDPFKRKQRAEAMWALLAQASVSSPDIVVTPAKVMINAKLFTGAVKTLGKLKPILDAAGVLTDPDTHMTTTRARA